MNNEQRIRGTELGPCPFCSGKVSAGQTTEEHYDSLLHTFPLCAKFVSMEPLEFITERNKVIALAQKQP